MDKAVVEQTKVRVVGGDNDKVENPYKAHGGDTGVTRMSREAMDNMDPKIFRCHEGTTVYNYGTINIFDGQACASRQSRSREDIICDPGHFQNTNKRYRVTVFQDGQPVYQNSWSRGDMRNIPAYNQMQQMQMTDYRNNNFNVRGGDFNMNTNQQMYYDGFAQQPGYYDGYARGASYNNSGDGFNRVLQVLGVAGGIWGMLENNKTMRYMSNNNGMFNNGWNLNNGMFNNGMFNNGMFNNSWNLNNGMYNNGMFNNGWNLNNGMYNNGMYNNGWNWNNGGTCRTNRVNYPLTNCVRY